MDWYDEYLKKAQEVAQYEAANRDLQLHFDALKSDYNTAQKEIDDLKERVKELEDIQNTAINGVKDIDGRCWEGDHVCDVQKLVSNLLKDLQ